MSKSMLLVGTRKGLFVLDSDDRRDWSVRGPYCESWPIYHAVLDRDSGTIYAAAASEWLGSAIWRSPDLGETWEHSSEGLGYPEEDGGLRLSKVSHVMPVHGRLLVGAESAGLFESTDGGKTFSLLTTFEGQEGREAWNDPAQQPPGHLGLSAIIPHPDEKDRFWVIVQGFSLFETNDGGQTWEPRNKGLRRDWPADYEDIGFCVHKVAPASDFERMFQQNHVGMHRSDDGGKSWTEITEGPADRVRLRGRDAPARPRHLLRDPARPGSRQDDARRQGSRLAHARRRLELAAVRSGPADRERVRRRAARRDGDRRARRARPVLRHQHRPAVREHRRGRELGSDRRPLPGHHLRHGGRRRLMAELHLPPVLPPLFPGLPRELEVEAATVNEAIDRLNERWPGLRDRLVEPGPKLRPHINVYVDRERGGLDTELADGSRLDVIAAISGG